MSQDLVDRLAAICLSLPEAEQRLSHGEQCWFIRGKKQFVAFDDHHHDADRIAFWCAAPEGSQRIHVESDPRTFFVPPYVGHRGWLGVRLDRDPDWAEVTEIVTEAYLTVAPRRLAALVMQRPD